ncbi:YveK family protein [Paucilactobacillus sp. N302-9]
MEDNLNVVDLVKVILKNFWLIIIFVVVGSAGAYGYSKWQNKNVVYEAKRQVVIYHNNTDQQGQYGQYTRDIGMMKTYRTIANNELIYRRVATQLKQEGKYKLSSKEIQNKVKASVKDQTTILTFTANDSNPKLAQTLANKTAESYKTIAPKVINIGQVKLLASAKNSDITSANGVSTKKYTLLGFIFGAVLGILVAWMKDIFILKKV